MSSFLDTFALVELVLGNAAFRPFLKQASTNVVNLYELHVAVARLDSEDAADLAYRGFRGFAVEITDADVADASRFKRAHPAGRFSNADALGYAMARRRGLTFVTGDRAFKDIDGVEFVASTRQGRPS